MGNNALNNDTLNEIRVEDYIWIIYIFLAIFAIISNHYEREYELKHQKSDKQTFRKINTTIFIIVFIIYIYFVAINYKHIKKLDRNSSLTEILLANAGFIAAILFLIAGLISLFISFFDTEEDIFLNFF